MNRTNSASPGSSPSGQNRLHHRVPERVRFKWRPSSRIFRPFSKNVCANMLEVYVVKLHFHESLLVGEGAPRIRCAGAR